MAIYKVTNSDELVKALSQAQGGDTIELDSGDYGQLDLITWKTFGVKAIYDSPVTIISADPENPASFSGLTLDSVQNLTFDNVVFDSNHTGGAHWVSPFMILGSSEITIRNSLFQGELASGTGDPTIDGYATGRGLRVETSTGITIENNEFTTWHRAMTFGGSSDIVVSGNDVHSIRTDGLNFAQVQNVLIEDNYIHDFARSTDSGDHSDMIQFWTNNTTAPSTDIIIRNNILDIGSGDETQSIFMRNEEVDNGRAGAEMFYQNVLIENNTIYNSHAHGISVGETNGLTITNNTVLRASNDEGISINSVTVPIIKVSSASTSVTVDGNITSAINGFTGQYDWTVTGNALVQPQEYIYNFILSTLESNASTHDYVIAPGSLVEQAGAGSDKVQYPYAAEEVTPYFQVHSDPSSSQILILDASLSAGQFGPLTENDAQFLWTFADGSTASGQVVKHDFGSAGYHDVKLTVTTIDGQTSQAMITAGIAGGDVLTFDADSGLFLTHSFGETTAAGSESPNLVDYGGAKAIDLGGSGVAAAVDKEYIQNLFGADAFEISMTLQADSFGSAGEVARVHQSLLMQMDSNGILTTTLWTTEGAVVVKTSGVRLNDGLAHDVVLRFNDNSDSVEVLVDGTLVGSAEVVGSMPEMQSWGLVFGNPWGKTNFDGKLSAFSIDVMSLDYPTYTGTAEVFASSQSTVETSVTEEPITTDDTVTVAEPTTDGDTATSATPGEDTTEQTTAEPTVTEDPVATDDSAIVTEPTTDGDTATSATPGEDTSEQTTQTEEPMTTEGSTSDDTSMINGGYMLDLSNLNYVGAHVIETQDGPVITFDGKRDHVSIEGLSEFESSQQIAFSIDFSSDASKHSERLVLNQNTIDLRLEGDGLRLTVANNDGYLFADGFQLSGLGLNDGDLHNVTIMLDAESDRLQIVVDDVLVLDEQGTDFDFVGAGGLDTSWDLGGTPSSGNRWIDAWNSRLDFEGDVYDFQVSDDFMFIESPLEGGTTLV